MTSPDSSLRYSQDEVQQILNLAIANQAHDGEFTQAQLQDIAAELEISPASLAQATQQWRQQQGDALRRQAFDHFRQSRLRRHLGQYAIIMAGLITLNLVTSGLSSFWVVYIALPWGMKLGLEAWNTFHTEGEAYERAFRHWQRKRQLKQWFHGLSHRLLGA